MMHLRKRVDTIVLPKPPVSVSPSGDFDGNDGNWSTFIINVNSDSEGKNGQNFKVLISTSSPLTLLPMQSDWCDLQCAGKRGVLPYNDKPVRGLEDSENWKEVGMFSIPLPNWYSDNFLGSNRSTSLAGVWGETNIGLGLSSEKSLFSAKRYAAKYIFNDFFMGSFGLAVGRVGGGENTTKANFLTQFDDDHNIASSSYGYTAGAWYRK